jgi:hypothetical protein
MRPYRREGLRLEQLGLPADVLIDPFDGKPLRYKHTPAGWRLYSIGKNLVNDGGRGEPKDDDVGLLPIAAESQPAQE